MVEKEGMTIEEFVELVLNTEAQEARTWFEKLKNAVPKMNWESYCRLPLTPGAVEFIAAGFSIQISRQLRAIPDKSGVFYNQCRKNGHALLQEIYRKALESGIEVKLENIDYFPAI